MYWLGGRPDGPAAASPAGFPEQDALSAGSGEAGGERPSGNLIALAARRRQRTVVADGGPDWVETWRDRFSATLDQRR